MKNSDSKKGLFGGLMFFIIVVSVSIIIACLAWTAATDVLALKSDNVEANVVLKKSEFTYKERTVKDDDGEKSVEKYHVADMGYVAKQLKDAGVIKYKSLFRLFCALTNAKEKIDPGTYDLKSTYDYHALVVKMHSGSNAMVTFSITFPEGYTMEKIFRKLDENGVCDYEDLMDAAANATFTYSFLKDIEKGDPSRLEGFLFPDTYEFYEGMPAATAINKFLEGFHYKLTAEMLEWLDKSGLTMREAVTIASMIEKEAANDSERYNIASVIFNRLKKGWPLQIDSTILYEYPEHEGAPDAAMLAKDTPYNTRINKGLPPTPISSPGIVSLKAALNPNETSYMYYALDTETGAHKFFKDSASFDAFVATQNYD